MTTRFATDTEISTWDELLLKNPDGGNVFSSREIAETKADNGWIPRYIMCEKNAVLALEKHIPLLGKFWYLPKGPGVITPAQLRFLLDPFKAFARSQGVFVIKIEPEILNDTESRRELAQMGLKRTFAVQPNASTVLIDLSPVTDDILMSFNQKGRNALRRAQREGVVTRAVDSTDENMQTMYGLLKTTAEGQWRLRGYDYFKEFWTTFSRENMGQMFFAEYQGEIVAASYGIIMGTKATYKDGCSVRERPVYGSSHLLQWEMMQWMKAHGAESYDLCGTPPSDQIHNPDHHFAGLARFKTSFNKHVTDYVGCYNLPINSFAYTIWAKIGERIVLRLHSQRHHTEWY